MTMWLTFAGAILLEVSGTLAMRASDAFRKRVWILPVAVAFTLSFWLLWLTLQMGMPVGIAYGLWSAIGVVLVALIARVWFKEPLTPLMLVGMALIIGGVLTIELIGSAH